MADGKGIETPSPPGDKRMGEWGIRSLNQQIMMSYGLNQWWNQDLRLWKVGDKKKMKVGGKQQKTIYFKG